MPIKIILEQNSTFIYLVGNLIFKNHFKNFLAELVKVEIHSLQSPLILVTLRYVGSPSVRMHAVNRIRADLIG